MGHLAKVQKIGLITAEEKSSQTTLKSKLIARVIQQLELYPHRIPMDATEGISLLTPGIRTEIILGASVTDLREPSLSAYGGLFLKLQVEVGQVLQLHGCYSSNIGPNFN